MPVHTLYFHDYCFFCRSVLHELAGLSLGVETRDILASPEYRNELTAGGGSPQVPCLLIRYDDGTARWMYESADIIDYLRSVDAGGTRPSGTGSELPAQP